MFGGAVPKQKSSLSSLGNDTNVEKCQSGSFELEPKPKLFCIPETCNRRLGGVRKTQSLSVSAKIEQPEKSFSVLFVGSKDHMMQKR